jgi:hypothetical protein
VTSDDQNGHSDQSGNNTFLTLQIPTPTPTAIPTATPTLPPGTTATPTPSPTVTPTPNPNSTPGPTATPSPTPDIDKEPPKVDLTTDFSKPYKTSPKVQGTATDNKQVTKLDYSIDNGKNWLPITDIKTKDNKKVTFTFQPPELYDGTYSLKVRAYDATENVGYSQNDALVIDILAPAVGASLISLGPQEMNPGSNGTIIVPASVNQRITVSTIGGPDTVDIIAQSIDNPKQDSQVFSLRKNSDNGLWTGVLNIAETGTYSLTATAVDGAKNKTSRFLYNVRVLPYGAILAHDKPLSGATITLYALDPITERYIIWDASSYGQINPQRTINDGVYTLYPPEGTYYLEVKKEGYQTTKTNIFTINGTSAINENFSLEKQRALNLGIFQIPFPEISFHTEDFKAQTVKNILSLSNDVHILNKKFPAVDYKVGSDSLNSNALLTSFHIVTFLNTWLPNASTQVSYLDMVQKQAHIGISVITPQEIQSEVTLFKARGNYTVPMFADANGTLVNPLEVRVVPMHFIIDKNGKIRKILYGVQTYEDLLKALGEIR